MPELPEVETVARQLSPLVKGKQLSKLEIYDPKLKISGLRGISGSRVKSVFRVGKEIVLELAKKQSSSYLSVHL